MSQKTSGFDVFIRAAIAITGLIIALWLLFVVAPNQANYAEGGILTALAIWGITIAGLLGLGYTLYQKKSNFKGFFSLNLVTLLGISMLASACYHTVPAGNRGVKVHLYGNSKGIDKTEVLNPGRYWRAWGVEYHNIPIYQKTYNFTQDRNESSPIDESISFQTGQGTKINADIGISYQIHENAVGKIFDRFRVDDITGALNQHFRNVARNEFNVQAAKLSIEDLLGPSRTMMVKAVEKRAKEEGEILGINVIYLNLTSDLRLPDEIRQAVNDKIRKIQQSEAKEFELREAIAQARVDSVRFYSEIQKAKAEAEANRIKASSITRELIEMEKVKKWDGKNPQVVSGGGGLMVDIK